MKVPKSTKTLNNILIICSLFLSHGLLAQDVAIKKKDQAHIDSLKSTPYPYFLPIYGDRVQKLGHDLPLPFGIMVNYVGQETRLDITNMQLSFDGSEFVPMEFIQFDTVKNTAHVVNVRADAWIFPFWNVYALYARTQSSNNIELISPFEFEIPTEPTADTYGMGTVLAYGSGNYFAVANFNAAWSHISSLNEPVFGTVTSFRVGRSFGFRKRYHNINLSIGLQHQYLARNSTGSLPLKDVFSRFDQAKLQEIKDEIGDAAHNWYDDLRPSQKIIVDKLVTEIDNWLAGRTPGDAKLGYRFDKEPLGSVSLQLGVQYNHGKSWWYRMETGIGRGRVQILLSANYRFGL
ncbi:hypothetical protein [Galbibacter pacificus]|uniref:Uncharacterized protein n=1 Tax=Galbibacter pacificus TaxID=2996052 RepID=A0ABT6FW74_9FLAO|nr:hypothetical protein [Galbibacter pacificus]MDG3584045.1 hypothetical protein [Galbibacter pacificus]MDG3587519.1 hypothetical protein [Galbibacter pacificus]